ncbi:MAG: hypothetical protein L0922_04480, partial [Candidatus Mariimomonas ferrooxydans]
MNLLLLPNIFKNFLSSISFIPSSSFSYFFKNAFASRVSDAPPPFFPPALLLHTTSTITHPRGSTLPQPSLTPSPPHYLNH